MKIILFIRNICFKKTYLIFFIILQKKLLLSKKISRPIDIDKQWFVFKGLKIFGLKPYTVSQNFKFGSEIDRIKSRKEITSSLKVKRNIKRILLSSEYRLKKFLYDLKNNI